MARCGHWEQLKVLTSKDVFAFLVVSCYHLDIYIYTYRMHLTNLSVYRIILYMYILLLLHTGIILPSFCLMISLSTVPCLPPGHPPSDDSTPARWRSNDGRRLRHPCFNGADGPSTSTEAEAKIGSWPRQTEFGDHGIRINIIDQLLNDFLFFSWVALGGVFLKIFCICSPRKIGEDELQKAYPIFSLVLWTPLKEKHGGSWLYFFLKKQGWNRNDKLDWVVDFF